MTVKVKICGVTTLPQVEMVQLSGADAIGLVLYDKSSRYVDLDDAIKLRRAISPDVLCVALVVNADEKFVQSVISELKPDFIQFHGDETAEFCNQFNYPYIRAIRMSEGLNILDEVTGGIKRRVDFCSTPGIKNITGAQGRLSIGQDCLLSIILI